MSPDLFSPWREFLAEVDSLLKEPCQLHCIGGFAVVSAYGLPRSTNDLDYISIESANLPPDLEAIAGEGSALDKKHRVHVHRVTIATVPEDYEKRLIELFANKFKNIRLLVLDPYDVVLSKLSRNIERDREDVAYLARTRQLDPNILRERYQEELRPNLIGPPERHDNTLKFWTEAYFSS
ncbi:MAG TPA: DUF6036 family nucleotidyltransferase [Candidatus Acidoferrales bacterium]|nr:DUF6036 family nucleotidyltransferase [Candidatus Acidoferrales bacterium]